MINVKDQVFAALSSVESAAKVSDIYPQDWTELPCIQYVEEANNVFEKTDQQEQLAQLRYRVDIWSKGSTSALALEVDEAVSALGLTRTSCMDVDDGTVMRHKRMIYEGVIDMEGDIVYWYGSR